MGVSLGSLLSRRRLATLLAIVASTGVLVPLTAPPAYATARFHIECPFVRHLPDDPIVHPRDPGASHLHAFFGNKSTDAFSTYRSLLRAGTTCRLLADKGAYWIPAVYKNGKLIRPNVANFYYRGQTTPLSAIRAFPPGLKIIAGNADATGPQSTKVIAWSCKGSAGTGRAKPRDCGGGGQVKVIVKFPSCWDGLHKDSPDHKAHMAYFIRAGSGRHVCPKSHPVPVPELTYSITFPFRNGSGMKLSLGPYYKMHGDFFNSWKQRALRRLVRRCIHGGIECPSFS